MNQENERVVEELKAFIGRLKVRPMVKVTSRLGPRASEKDCARHEGVLSPPLIEFARVVNGVRLYWTEDGVPKGALHIPTLREFAASKEQWGIEVTDDEVIQKLNLETKQDFACFFGDSDEFLLFDGDYLRPAIIGTIADWLTMMTPTLP